MEWTAIDGVAIASTDPEVPLAVRMQTSLVVPGTRCVLQFEAVLHWPSPAFPVQSTLQLCACASLPTVTATASNKAARKNILVLCIFIPFLRLGFADDARQGRGIRPRAHTIFEKCLPYVC